MKSLLRMASYWASTLVNGCREDPFVTDEQLADFVSWESPRFRTLYRAGKGPLLLVATALRKVNGLLLQFRWIDQLQRRTFILAITLAVFLATQQEKPAEYIR